VNIKNAVFWDVTLCGSCKNRRFGGTYRLHHQGLRSVCRLIVTANVQSSQILVTLMMEALSSSETSVLTRATRRNIPEYLVLPMLHCSSSRSVLVAIESHNIILNTRKRRDKHVNLLDVVALRISLYALCARNVWKSHYIWSPVSRNP
jgi:hypothetical protein